MLNITDLERDFNNRINNYLHNYHNNYLNNNNKLLEFWLQIINLSMSFLTLLAQFRILCQFINHRLLILNYSKWELRMNRLNSSNSNRDSYILKFNLDNQLFLAIHNNNEWIFEAYLNFFINYLIKNFWYFKINK